MLPMEDENDLSCIGFMFDASQRKTAKKFFICDTVQVSLVSIDDNPGALQSGHYIWPASPALSEYLVQEFHLCPDGDVMELGSGCGLAGLVAAQLRPKSKVILTDHDPGIIKSLQSTIPQQNFYTRHCRAQALRWGPDGDDDIKAICKYENNLEYQVAVIIGADVIYSHDIVDLLFYTIEHLLQRKSGVFLLASSFGFDAQVEIAINQAAMRYGLKRKIISCNLDSKGARLESFKRTR